MNENQLEQGIIELALEMYWEENGEEQYNEFVGLMDSNPDLFDQKLEDFIAERQADLVYKSLIIKASD